MEPVTQTRLADPEVLSDLLEGLSRFTVTGDAHHVVTKLSGVGSGHGTHPSSSTRRHHRSGVTYWCSSPGVRFESTRVHRRVGFVTRLRNLVQAAASYPLVIATILVGLIGLMLLATPARGIAPWLVGGYALAVAAWEAVGMVRQLLRGHAG